MNEIFMNIKLKHDYKTRNDRKHRENLTTITRNLPLHEGWPTKQPILIYIGG